MRAGTIARNESGVVGVVTGRDFYEAQEEYNHYEKDKNTGKHVFIEVRKRTVTKRRHYIGKDMRGRPWKAETITPLTAEEKAAL